MDDSELLQAFVQRRDEAAFRQIVDRYTAVVYAAARRHVGAEHLSEDITQAVFILLARRAHRVRGGAALAGWLVNATRLAALNAARVERRIRSREQKVAAMASTSTNDDSIPAELREMTPLLDAALARLAEQDRTAVTLRYLQGKTVGEVGVTMGISEWAAAKRINRAVAKLRDEFARRGVDTPVASITAGLLAHAAGPNMMAGLSERLATTALAADPTSTTVGWTLAQLIAQQVVRFMVLKQAVTTAAVAAVVLVVIGGAGWIVHNLRGNAAHNGNGIAVASPNATVAPAGSPLLAAGGQDTGPIRVGVILSDMTAKATFDGNPYGYGNQSRILGELRDRTLDISPIIEPGTDKEPALAAVLQRSFPNKPPIDGFDADELRKLDVIVGAQLWEIHVEMVTALTSAVNDGVGLIIRQGLGETTPGMTPEVMRLHGIAEGYFGQTQPWRKPVACTIVGEHPILGRLSGRLGDALTTLPCGSFGILAPGSVPLVRVKDLTDVNADIASLGRDDLAFYPLYVSHLGRGKIIACVFDVHAPPAKELQNATGGNFTDNCVKWLAVEHRNAATQPAAPLEPATRPVDQ